MGKQNDDHSTPTSDPKGSSFAHGLGDIPLRSLCRRPPLMFTPDSPIRDVLAALGRTGCDAGLVAEQVEKPLGIVTMRNLLDGIAFQGGSLNDPIIAFMTVAPRTLPADAPAHRAKVLMTRCRLKHLILTETDGRFFNLISQADIPGHLEGGAGELADQINACTDIDILAAIAADARKNGAALFAAGMGVDALCQWMSRLNDLICMRIIELTSDRFDMPPVSWCWMVFGSEGRLEQTFLTDQDNGLIFKPDQEKDAESVRRALLPFAGAVNQALDRCGFAKCQGKIMAGNPAWCLSIREWRERFGHWMTTPEPEAILHATIFFDFRPLYGQDDLVDGLRSWLLPLPAQHPRFLHCLSEQALDCSPALGFMDRFVYDGGKRFPHTIDLKMHGVRPFVDVARIWALQHHSWATNTTDRLRSTADAMHRSPAATAAMVEAFELVQRFRIQQQLSAPDPEIANRLDPQQLNPLQKMMLKEAMKQAKLLQLRLKQDFAF